METKEIIITSETSEDTIKEAIDAITYVGLAGMKMEISQIAPIADDDKVQTLRTFSFNGTTVTVTEDAYVSFIDSYLLNKIEKEEELLNRALCDAEDSKNMMTEMWENAGYEYPFKNN